jgi:hypothetical protein
VREKITFEDFERADIRVGADGDLVVIVGIGRDAPDGGKLF